MNTMWMFVWTIIAIVCATGAAIASDLLAIIRIITLCVALVCTFMYGYMRGEESK